MIAYPDNWWHIGRPIVLSEIEDRLCQAIEELGVKNLSLSGGIDSSYLLYCMTKVFKKSEMCTYTMALNDIHPDWIFSKQITEYFDVRWCQFIPKKPPVQEEGDYPGDAATRLFYDYLQSEGVGEILAGDTVDEWLAGYYLHAEKQDEATYYRLLGELVKKHLEPLNRNSGNIKVYLPYAEKDLIALYSQIPLNIKNKERKFVMMELAKGKLPKEILERRKYGMCDSMIIKERTK